MFMHKTDCMNDDKKQDVIYYIRKKTWKLRTCSNKSNMAAKASCGRDLIVRSPLLDLIFNLKNLNFQKSNFQF